MKGSILSIPRSTLPDLPGVLASTSAEVAGEKETNEDSGEEYTVFTCSSREGAVVMVTITDGPRDKPDQLMAIVNSARIPEVFLPVSRTAWRRIYADSRLMDEIEVALRNIGATGKQA